MNSNADKVSLSSSWHTNTKVRIASSNSTQKVQNSAFKPRGVHDSMLDEVYDGDMAEVMASSARANGRRRVGDGGVLNDEYSPTTVDVEYLHEESDGNEYFLDKLRIGDTRDEDSVDPDLLRSDSSLRSSPAQIRHDMLMNTTSLMNLPDAATFICSNAYENIVNILQQANWQRLLNFDVITLHNRVNERRGASET
ncbi:hypothetical protein [Brucella anthropi]|uniref:hypothetical protein n=1 Tax=Brucella anthropi TaxID=529 RepID=UPI00384A7F48